MSRHPDSPLIMALYFGLAVLLGVAIGFVEGMKHRECPRVTPDGRPFTAYVVHTGECKYSPIPRPALELSPTELRRMAAGRERLERIK